MASGRHQESAPESLYLRLVEEAHATIDLDSCQNGHVASVVNGETNEERLRALERRLAHCGAAESEIVGLLLQAAITAATGTAGTAVPLAGVAHGLEGG